MHKKVIQELQRSLYTNFLTRGHDMHMDTFTTFQIEKRAPVRLHPDFWLMGGGGGEHSTKKY